MSDGSPTPPFHKKRRESFVMSSKGKTLGLFAQKGVNAKSVLNFDEIDWPHSKVSLVEVMGDEGLSVKVDKEGNIVGGLLTLLKYKAYHPSECCIEVLVVGDDELPSFNEIEVAA